MGSVGDGNSEARDSLGAEELRALLSGVAGVAVVEIDLRDDDSPRLQVRLDGTVSEAEMSELIRRAISESNAAGVSTPERRVGLGRGLSDILAADGESVAPIHLQHPVAEPMGVLVMVAVEETAGGISVRAAASAGGVAFSPVEDPRSLNQAVVSAVGRLRQERPLPRLAGVEVRDVDGAPVLTVVLGLSDGRRVVGSTLVEGGMPFTLGRAVWEALASPR